MARGMANNEPTVSQANTDDFRDGYDRAFGEQPTREPGRRSYVYRGGRLVERGGPDDTGCDDPRDEARLHVVSDLYMVGVTVPGPNGPIDIGSRAKRREHMTHDPVTHERRELADMSDYEGKGGEWERAAQVREQIKAGTYGRENRRDVIGRRLYEAQMKDRNRK